MQVQKFQGNGCKEARKKWEELLDQLNNCPNNDINSPEFKMWREKLSGLVSSLFQEMGEILGYDFDPVKIKKGCYLPQGHAKSEQEWEMIRMGI